MPKKAKPLGEVLPVPKIDDFTAADFLCLIYRVVAHRVVCQTVVILGGHWVTGRSGRKDGDMPQQAFALALRTQRQKHGIAQEKLALEAGIARSHLSDLERGKRDPKLTTMFRLCKTLEIPFTELAFDIQRNYATRRRH